MTTFRHFCDWLDSPAADGYLILFGLALLAFFVLAENQQNRRPF